VLAEHTYARRAREVEAVIDGRGGPRDSAPDRRPAAPAVTP
jgi:hypothetical protein